MREDITAPSGVVYDTDPELTGVVRFPVDVEIVKGGVGLARQLPAKISWEDLLFLAAVRWREELIERVRNADPVLFPALSALLFVEARDGR